MKNCRSLRSFGFRLGLLLSLLLSFSACTPQAPENQIIYSTWGSPEEMEILQPLLDEFKRQNPEIDVKLMHIPDKYFQKIHALLAANLAPDVMFLNNINFPVYASNDAFLNLEPFLEKSNRIKQSDFYTRILDGFRWQGNIQGLPRDASNLVFFYNQDMFDRVGVPYPTEDWTWEDMLEIAQKLTLDQNKDGNPEHFGVSFHDYFLFWFPYVWSAGGDIFDSERKSFTLNQTEALQGLQFHADLRHKHHVAPTAAQAGSLSMSQMFMQEKLAMNLNGRWAVPLYRKSLEFKWDIAPFPKGKAGSVVDADASGWVISKKTKSPEKAWKLVEFLASAQASKAFTAPGLIIPARKDVAQSEVFLAPDLAPQHAKHFLNALDTGKPMPAVPYWNAVMDEVNQALEPVWSGESTAEQALKSLPQRVEPLL